MKEKKILFLIDSLKFGGGTEKVLSLLANYLSIYYNITVLTINDYEDKYLLRRANYFSLKENLKTSSKLVKFLKIPNIMMILKIYKLIKTTSPEILISFTTYVNLLTILTKFLFNLKIPLIISVRCNPLLQYKEEGKSLNILIKLLYRLKVVDKIVTVSEGVNSILQNNYRIKGEKLITIYNGTEIEKIRKLSKEEISEYHEVFYDKNSIKFINFGRISREKGHKYLIHAFYIVKSKIPNVKLIIIGDGPLKNEIKALINKLNLKEDILLIGFQKNPFKYIGLSDIFILSSSYEGFPNSIIEVLACGLPIISTDCKMGPKEILGNNKYGILTKVDNPHDLALKMEFLAQNPRVQKILTNKSLERVKIFDIKIFINKWIGLIENLISKSIS